jgi:o-succinylbenzoate synthase
VKITRIDLAHLRMPLRAPFETSFGRIDTRDCLLLQAYGEGLVGLGECVADAAPGFSYETAATAWHVLVDFLAPAVLGRELSEPGEVQTLTNFVRGHPMAKSALEMVVWDLLGKIEGRSLKEMLGGTRDQVEVGVSVGLQPSSEALVQVAAGYLEAGYRRIKIKIKPGRDVSEARAVRQAFPDLRLQVDANSAYRLEDAAALQPLDELDLLMIEQPLAEDDILDHSRLQPLLRTSLCLDESIISARHARQALETGACRIINIKTGRVGGLSQARAIHDVCQKLGAPVWSGGMLETGVGRAANLALASLPNFTLPGDISATDRYYEQDITQERFCLNSDSTIDVPAGVGLGVALDPKALERFTLARLSLKAA